MRRIKITIENLLFFLVLTTGNSIASNQKKSKAIHTISAQKKALIFELDGVLFEESRRGYIKKIGFGSLARYKMSCWQDPGDACLDMLEHISKNEKKSSPIPIIRKGRQMPCCIHDLQCGKKNHQEVRLEIAKHIEDLDKKNYFKSGHQKYIHQQIVDISLDPEELPNIAKLNKPMVQLVKKLKASGYQVYILANLSNDQYKQLINTYPKFAKLFDDIVISANVKTVKPDQQIYKYLLDKHSLMPESCILIDNREESISTAQQLGITGIFFDNKYHATIQKLQELGITC